MVTLIIAVTTLLTSILIPICAALFGLFIF